MKKKLALSLLVVAIVVLIVNFTSAKGELYSELCITMEEEQEIIRSRKVASKS